MGVNSKPRWGSWLVLAVLIGLLVVAIVTVYLGWDSREGAAMTTMGYVAMALGIVATLALGIGLMALVFYSSRSGRD